jgi:hypothetical protein
MKDYETQRVHQVDTRNPMMALKARRLRPYSTLLLFVLAAFSMNLPCSSAAFLARPPCGSLTTPANKDETKTLWYRDREPTEEEMAQTTPGKPRMQRSPTGGSVEILQLPLGQSNPEASSAGENKMVPLFDTGAVNLPLVKSMCLSQFRMFSVGFVLASLYLVWNTGAMDLHHIHWNSAGLSANPQNYHSLLDWHATPVRLLDGVLAAVPLIALGTMVEQSEHRPASHFNFSITNTVISLFGRRRKPNLNQVSTSSNVPPCSSTFQVTVFSLGLAAVSAISQELIYRGLLPAVLVSCSHSVVTALLGQSLLFGLGQLRRTSSLQENAAFVFINAFNALWYGSVYLATGGDILPVILAHLLYESHILVETWKRINDQMEWTEHSSPKQLSAHEELQLKQIQLEAGGSLAPETLGFCRRFFYAFDHEHKGTLSLPDVQRAVAYAFLHDPIVPSTAKVEALFQEMARRRHQQGMNSLEGVIDDDRLYLPEFLRLLFALKSKAWKN